MMGLTKRQAECLTFIRTRMDENGVAPSFVEIMVSQGLRSKSGVHRLIAGLEQRGFIRRIPGAARAIELIELSSNKAVLLSPETFGLVQIYAGSLRVGIDAAVDAIVRERLGVSA